MKHAAETMEELIERDDLINFTQFVWLINGAVDWSHAGSASAAFTTVWILTRICR